MPRCLPTIAGAALWLVAFPASAQRDLEAPQPTTWYVTHGTTAGVTIAAALTINAVATPEATPRWAVAPAFERGTEQNLSPASARPSDVGLLTTTLGPFALFATQGRAAGPQTTIHFEVLGVSLFLNTGVKHLVRRARPYFHRRDPAGRALVAEERGDAVLSFYSGHAALSFAGASSGGALYASTSDDVPARATVWGVGATLAALTAHLRVRAGRHYPTDVVTGALLGVAVGVGLPLAHDVRVPLEPAEWASAGGGVALGTLLGFLFPRQPARSAAAYVPTVLPVPGGATAQLSGAF